MPETAIREILQKALKYYPQISAGDIVLPVQLPVRVGAWLQMMRAAHDKEQNPFLANDVVTFGDFKLESATGRLENIKTGDVQTLTEKERAFIVTLARAEGRKLERSEMLLRVWGYKEDLETHTLETHLYRLRQKIEADPANPVNLVTRDSVYYLAT